MGIIFKQKDESLTFVLNEVEPDEGITEALQIIAWITKQDDKFILRYKKVGYEFNTLDEAKDYASKII